MDSGSQAGPDGLEAAGDGPKASGVDVARRTDIAAAGGEMAPGRRACPSPPAIAKRKRASAPSGHAARPPPLAACTRRRAGSEPAAWGVSAAHASQTLDRPRV
jgi:hypothetical protein